MFDPGISPGALLANQVDVDTAQSGSSSGGTAPRIVPAPQAVWPATGGRSDPQLFHALQGLDVVLEEVAAATLLRPFMLVDDVALFRHLLLICADISTIRLWR